MRPALNMDLPEPEWLALLRAEQAKGKSVVALSRECGIPRSSLQMLLTGTYPAKSLDLVSRKHAARIVGQYRNQVLCPHLRRGLGAEECRSFAAAPMSTSSPTKLAHWAACQRCAFNPKAGEPK